MASGRKPTTKEFNEIVADIVRLYQSDKEKYDHFLGNRDAVEGNKNNTDEQEARYQLKYATIVIVDDVISSCSLMVTEKAGFIFWYSDNYYSVLTLNNDGKLSIMLKEYMGYVG